MRIYDKSINVNFENSQYFVATNPSLRLESLLNFFLASLFYVDMLCAFEALNTGLLTYGCLNKEHACYYFVDFIASSVPIKTYHIRFYFKCNVVGSGKCCNV